MLQGFHEGLELAMCGAAHPSREKSGLDIVSRVARATYLYR